MANFGDILSSLSIGAGQSVRRNAANSAFEAFTPTAGTVTSVGITVPSYMTAGSAVTTSGNISLAFNNQTANTGFFGPSSGGSGAVGFRALVAADLPTVPINKGGTNSTSHATNGIAYFNGAAIVTNAGLSYSSNNFAISGGSSTSIQGNVGSVNPVLYLIGGTGGVYPTMEFRPEGRSDRGGVIQSNSTNGGLTYVGRGGGSALLVQTDTASGKILVARGTTSQSGNLIEAQNVGGTRLASFAAAGHLDLADAVNMIFGTSTGTKIGTGATQKISMWNATPVTQRVDFTSHLDGTGGSTSPNGLIDTGNGDTNDNFAKVSQMIEEIRQILKDVGIIS